MKKLQMKFFLLSEMIEKRPELYTLGNGLMLTILSILQHESLGAIVGIIVFAIGSIFTILKQKESWKDTQNENYDKQRNRNLDFAIKLKESGIDLKDLEAIQRHIIETQER